MILILPTSKLQSQHCFKIDWDRGQHFQFLRCYVQVIFLNGPPCSVPKWKTANEPKQRCFRWWFHGNAALDSIEAPVASMTFLVLVLNWTVGGAGLKITLCDVLFLFFVAYTPAKLQNGHHQCWNLAPFSNSVLHLQQKLKKSFEVNFSF